METLKGLFGPDDYFVGRIFVHLYTVFTAVSAIHISIQLKQRSHLHLAGLCHILASGSDNFKRTSFFIWHGYQQWNMSSASAFWPKRSMKR
jgi:hypothetical protein